MRIESLEAMEHFAVSFIKDLEPKKEHATVIGLAGELGSGKTTFVQGVARALGIQQTITSPTFVILKQYQVHAKTFKQLVHVDAYRLTEGTELARLNWRMYTDNPGNLICVEWPEHVVDVLPEDRQTLSFTFIDETTREVIISNG